MPVVVIMDNYEEARSISANAIHYHNRTLHIFAVAYVPNLRLDAQSQATTLGTKTQSATSHKPTP